MKESRPKWADAVSVPIYSLRFLAAQKPIANGINAADPHAGETGLDEGTAVAGVEVAGCDGGRVAAAGVVLSEGARVGQGVGVSVSQMKS